MKTLFQDVRYGLRVLAKAPGFTAVAVLAIALGVAANSAIFSVINAVLLEPLPYREPGRLVSLWEMNRARDARQNVLSPANLIDWKEQTDVFEDVAAFTDGRANLTGDGEPEEVIVQQVTPNLFPLLGVEPIKGRGFAPDDAKPGAARTVVLSHGFWLRRFGGDPAVVGKSFNLGGAPATVVGVMPARFQWFIRKGSRTAAPPEMWSPFALSDAYRKRQGRYMSAVARLKDGVTRERAELELNHLARRLEEQYPEFNKGWGAEVVLLRDQFAGPIRPVLWVLLGAVGFLLLIACANVANLLLARGATRQKEIAIRTALGAGRARVVRQLLTESLLLAFTGGGLGLLLAWWGVELLVALSPRDVLDLGGVGLNVPVLLFTLGVSFVTGVVFGVVPAFEASRVSTSESLKEGAKGTTVGKRGGRLRGAFVVAEIALALILLVGAGLMLKSFARLRSVDPGFRADNLLTMRVSLPARKYKEDAQVVAFSRQAAERLAALPGVEAAGAVNYLPFAGPGAATNFKVVGRPDPPPGEEPDTDVRVTDENYFRAMGIPLLRGRMYTPQESAERGRVAVVSQSFAEKYFPGEEVIGRQLLVNMKSEPNPTEVVGVVADIKLQSLDEEPHPTVYWPHAELVYSNMVFVVRTKGDPAALGAAARGAVQSIDADQPVADLRPMTQFLAESVGRARFSATLLGVFALLALVLAGVGVYGVMSYAVAQRTHEIGVRVALGAQTRDVLRLVVGHGMALAGAGLAAGLLGAFALTRLLSSLLFQVSTTDLATYATLTGFLLLVSLAACLVPARRATKVDPMVALRYE
ncbi:MAG TPA: ABC transporter permease [Pyrinomonadaceae bacterium]|jgi:putative ABC transport system permease protein